MSATFIANGEDAVVLGFNQLIVRNVGALPFVYCGAIGPVPLPGATARRVVDAVRRSAGAFSLRGLGSLDFMRSDDTFSVLEVNPRPPASVELYRDRAGVAGSRPAARGVVAAHVRACQHGELPHWAPAPGGPAVTGTQIVFAPRPVWLDDGDVRRLAALASCHDLPAAAGRFEAGDPVCSVSAHADSAAQVRALLERECENVHRSLETCS
jgi:predicted ATP-grasp superfamily ATP-dependent carboligase